MSDTYTFGDTPAAARRLQLLATVFDAPTRRNLSRWAPGGPRHAADLGCGPGWTTHLVHEVTGAAHTTGVERSAAFVQEAATRAVPGVSFVQHDVTVAPFPMPPADLVHVRFLLTHLADPVAALEVWAGLLAPGGRLIVQETARLESTDPALARYYVLVGRLQAHHGQATLVGGQLGELAARAGARAVHTGVQQLRPPVAAMAALHALNVRTWRNDSFAVQEFDAAELDELTQRLDELADGAPPAGPVELDFAVLVISGH